MRVGGKREKRLGKSLKRLRTYEIVKETYYFKHIIRKYMKKMKKSVHI